MRRRQGLGKLAIGLGLLLCVEVACGGSLHASPAPLPEAIAEPSATYASPAFRVMFESSLRVHVDCVDGREALGSGVAVSPRTAMTSRHVVTDGCKGAEPWRLTALTQDGRALEVVADDLGDDVDAARLLTVGMGEPFYVVPDLREDPPTLGETVCSITGGTDLAPEPRCGLVAVLEPMAFRPGPGMEADRGDSGAPVFDDSGRVVGIWTTFLDGSRGRGRVAAVAAWHRMVR